MLLMHNANLPIVLAMAVGRRRCCLLIALFVAARTAGAGTEGELHILDIGLSSPLPGCNIVYEAAKIRLPAGRMRLRPRAAQPPASAYSWYGALLQADWVLARRHP